MLFGKVKFSGILVQICSSGLAFYMHTIFSFIVYVTVKNHNLFTKTFTKKMNITVNINTLQTYKLVKEV